MAKKIRGSRERTLAGTTMRSSLERIIREEDITTHFQPIVDLHDETILGFEVLSRTQFPLSCPTELFRVADAPNLSWEREGAVTVNPGRKIADGQGMQAILKINVDPVHGIEYRAQARRDCKGWIAEWRPVRALREFQAFTYISRDELFGSEKEAIDFIRLNAASIVSRRI